MIKLAKLDALRGFASIYVLLHHVATGLVIFGIPVGLILKFGQEAVILFFLLSGFVIQYSFTHAKDKRFPTYFMKRFTRIYIPLIFVFVLSYILLSLQEGIWVDPHWKNLLLNFLMLQDIPSLKPAVIAEPYMNNAPLWSLSYEWWFYMLFFAIYKIFGDQKKKHYWVYALSILASAVYVFHPDPVSRVLMYFAIWWAGASLAELFIKGKGMTLRSFVLPIGSLGVITLLLTGAAISELTNGGYKGLGVHPILEIRHFLFAIVALVIAFYWKSRQWKGFDATIGKFLIFAPISYVIYISHYIFILRKEILVPVENHFMQYVGVFFFIFLFAYVVEIKLYPSLRKFAITRMNLMNTLQKNR